jgi:iron complex outermembrane receptor protein
MQDMEWGDEHAPNIDINSADHISVVKGAAALQYAGDAIGGVVIIEKARIPAQDTLFGKTLIDFISNGRGSSVSTELTKAYKSGWYLRGQASIKKLGDREAPDYILSNSGAEELGLSLDAGMRRFDKGLELDYSFYHADIAILRASHIGNADDLIQSINTRQPSVVVPFTYSIDRPRQEITHHLGKISYYKRFTGLGKWSLQYDFQNNRRFEYDIRVGADRDKPSIDLELSTHSLSTDFIWDASRQYKAQLGFTGRFQDNFANPDTGVRRLIPDYRKYDLGAFLTGEYRILDGIMIEAGLRYDFNRMDARKFSQLSRWEERGYETEFSEFIIEDIGTQLLTNPVFNYHNISASAGLLVAKNNSSVFRANYVRSQRAPNPSELFSDGLHHSAARIELGDLRIGNETSHKIALSYTKKEAKWGYSLEPYVNFIRDFILSEPSGVEFTLRGAFPVWNYRQNNAKLLGIDASAYLHWAENWESKHNISLVKGTDSDRKTALIDMPAPILKNSVSFLKPQWHNFEISLVSTYSWEQNEYPPNIEVFSPAEQRQVILDINTPPGAYHLLSLRTRMEFDLGGSMWLSTGLKAENLLNTNYRDYLNRQRYYADDLGRNIVLQLKFNY